MIVEPNPALGIFLLRLGLGVVFLAHGPDKLMDPSKLAKGTGMSQAMVILVGLFETLGAASMIAGIRIDIGALMLATVMLGAMYFKTQRWNRKFTGEHGWELDFIILAALIAVFLSAPSGYGLF